MNDTQLWEPASPLASIGNEQSLTTNLAKALSDSSIDLRVPIQILKAHPLFKKLFESSARVYEGYSIESHTFMVMSQYRRYSCFATQNFSTADSYLLLLLHDIGKPIPEDKHDQVRETLKIIKETRALLPVTDATLLILCELLACDVLGPLAVRSLVKKPTLEEKRNAAHSVVKGEDCFVIAKSLAERSVVYEFEESIRPQVLEAAERIRMHSKQAKIEVREFLWLLMNYYKSDTLAYTPDATDWRGKRGFPSLDYLFASEPSFSPVNVESRMFLIDETSRYRGVKFSSMMQRVFGMLIKELNG